MTEYTPELGQMVFGQPWKEHKCPEYVITILDTIDNYMDINRICGDGDFRNTPFSNSGLRFKNETFEANAYDWSECECGANWGDNKECTCGWEPQPYNFKWKDIEISWYKHSHRGVTINRKVTQKEVAIMLTECLQSLMA